MNRYPSFKKNAQFKPEATGQKNQHSAKKNIDSISEPSASEFFFMCVIIVFKKVVFAPVHVKIGLYMGTLIICSLLHDFNLVSNRFYFAQKHNLFNVYFVKFGWFWTLVTCIPFVLMTSIVYTGFNKMFIRNNLARLGVATVMWFVFTNIFETIDSRTGVCMLASIKSKHECKAQQHQWLNGFDISGHTFILMHSLFLILEEVKVYNNWENLRKKLNEISKNDDFTPSTERAFYWYNLLTPYIKINFCLLALLSLLWEIMLLSTFLYFHTIMHKLLAASFAIVIWFVTYKKWYKNNNLFMSPGMPGTGIEKLSL